MNNWLTNKTGSLPVIFFHVARNKLEWNSHKFASVWSVLIQGPFQYPNEDFPTLSYTQTCEIPTLLYTVPEA